MAPDNARKGRPRQASIAQRQFRHGDPRSEPERQMNGPFTAGSNETCHAFRYAPAANPPPDAGVI
jgi:hypothetical protein